METITRPVMPARSLEEVRRLLQPVLLQLQEQEGTTVGSVRTRVMEVAGILAGVMSTLYRATRDRDSAPDSSIVATTYAKLELTLKLMDDLAGVDNERRAVAQALSLLFALGHGSKSGRPPLRRSSTNMRAVRASETGRPRTPPSAPSIEVCEVDPASLGLDLDSLNDPPDHALDDAPDDAPASERRSSPRIAFEVDVGFVSESHFYAGISMDVSTGGLFVATYRMLPVGSQVAVTFVLPNGYAITADAVVRWVRQQSEEASPGMGLEFVLAGEDQAQVRAFCDRRQPLFIDMD